MVLVLGVGERAAGDIYSQPDPMDSPREPSCLLWITILILTILILPPPGSFPPAPARCPPHEPPQTHLPSQVLCRWVGAKGQGALGSTDLLKDGPGAGEAQDGPSDNVDTPVIGGVELEGDIADLHPCPRMHRGGTRLSPSHPIPSPLTSSTMEPNSRSR